MKIRPPSVEVLFQDLSSVTDLLHTLSVCLPRLCFRLFILRHHGLPLIPHSTHPLHTPHHFIMSDSRRLLEAANALSQLLRQHSIAHAFYGSILTAVLSDNPRCDVGKLCLLCPHTLLLTCFQEIFCIVEGGPTHPFRRVRQAVVGSEHFTTTHSPWSNRYRSLLLVWSFL
jgi:hypothetical protein